MAQLLEAREILGALLETDPLQQRAREAELPALGGEGGEAPPFNRVGGVEAKGREAAPESFVHPPLPALHLGEVL